MQSFERELAIVSSRYKGEKVSPDLKLKLRNFYVEILRKPLDLVEPERTLERLLSYLNALMQTAGALTFLFVFVMSGKAIGNIFPPDSRGYLRT